MNPRQLRQSLLEAQSQQEYEAAWRAFYAEEDARLEAYNKQSERITALAWLLLAVTIFMVVYAITA